MGENNSSTTIKLAPKRYEFVTNIRQIKPKSELSDKVEKTASDVEMASSITVKGLSAPPMQGRASPGLVDSVEGVDSIKTLDLAQLFASQISQQALALGREELLSSVAGQLDPATVFLVLKD